MFQKILVANRGEIAIRAFRAAYELGARTVAVYPARTATRCTARRRTRRTRSASTGHPVRAYLDVDEIIRVAQEAGADAIYPGYGFLSENPELRARRRGQRHHLHRPHRRRAGDGRQQGDRQGSARSPRACPCSPSTPGIRRRGRCSRRSRRRSASRSSSRRSPGGGGRGMRRVERRADLRAGARRGHARGRGARSATARVFLEQAVVRPRHIEVQILADDARRRDPPVRARLLGAAPPPEGHRDRAGAEPRPTSCATAHAPRRRSRSRGRSAT